MKACDSDAVVSHCNEQSKDDKKSVLNKFNWYINEDISTMLFLITKCPF